jgi:acetyl-CoA synthetase
MRRILRKVACKEEDSIGDISTLNEPSVVNELISNRQ